MQLLLSTSSFLCCLPSLLQAFFTPFWTAAVRPVSPVGCWPGVAKCCSTPYLHFLFSLLSLPPFSFEQELCDLGTLRSVALEWQIAGEGDLQMHERLTLLLGAARGLKYLHSKGIVHGDLVSIVISSTSIYPQ